MQGMSRPSSDEGLRSTSTSSKKEDASRGKGACPTSNEREKDSKKVRDRESSKISQTGRRCPTRDAKGHRRQGSKRLG